MKVIDPTGVELSPGDPKKCLGNGEQVDDKGRAIECCCDECDYFLRCFPEWEDVYDPQSCINDYTPASLDKEASGVI